MKSEELFEVLGNMNEAYVKEAAPARRTRRPMLGLAGLAAACLCLVLLLPWTQGPNPAPVQVPSPILEVESREQMEAYLDFQVPVLDKEVAAYQVYITDGYPRMACVEYGDGSQFRMAYDTGDISGIYGGRLVKEERVSGVMVSSYVYDSESGPRDYALWETGGFTCSYLSASEDPGALQTLIDGMSR
ncbi:MAG: hypothetical protein Q4F17_07105 [Eubacteriales bacterium]|nr:hypothetical protein [Eubacteriales bacterium]